MLFKATFVSLKNYMNPYLNAVHANLEHIPFTIVYDKEYKQTYKVEKLHSYYDHPAVSVMFSGSRYWYKYGQIHRDFDLPAIVLSNGSREWVCKGKCYQKEISDVL